MNAHSADVTFFGGPLDGRAYSVRATVKGEPPFPHEIVVAQLEEPAYFPAGSMRAKAHKLYEGIYVLEAYRLRYRWNEAILQGPA